MVIDNTKKISDVLVTPLKIINVDAGNVYHAMKSSDSGFSEFGEAYFSTISNGRIKAWKRHRMMTLNLVVPVGCIRFVIYDDRHKSPKENTFQVVELSLQNYCRLTIPPMLWFGFKGCGQETNILLNIASIPHSPDEVDTKSIGDIDFHWDSIC